MALFGILLLVDIHLHSGPIRSNIGGLMRIKIKEEKRTWRSKSRYWVAMGTLAACAGVSANQIAFAQSNGAPGQQKPTEGMVVRRFDIPATALAEALAAFTADTQVYVEV